MSTSSGKLARHWSEEVGNRRRAEAVDERHAPDGSGFMPGVGDVRGSDEFKARMAEILRALPDLRIAIDDVIRSRESEGRQDDVDVIVTIEPPSSRVESLNPDGARVGVVDEWR
jgi:hypothetical protein